MISINLIVQNGNVATVSSSIPDHVCYFLFERLRFSPVGKYKYFLKIKITFYLKRSDAAVTNGLSGVKDSQLGWLAG